MRLLWGKTDSVGVQRDTITSDANPMPVVPKGAKSLRTRRMQLTTTPQALTAGATTLSNRMFLEVTVVETGTAYFGSSVQADTPAVLSANNGRALATGDNKQYFFDPFTPVPVYGMVASGTLYVLVEEWGA